MHNHVDLKIKQLVPVDLILIVWLHVNLLKTLTDYLQIDIVDMREELSEGNRSMFSKDLREAIQLR
jgi:primosomal protein N'